MSDPSRPSRGFADHPSGFTLTDEGLWIKEQTYAALV